MNIIRKLLSGVQPQYLVKAYFFSVLLTFLGLYSSDSVFMVIYIIICGLLFPFASVVWDDLIGAIMGETIIVLPLLIMLAWKFFKLLLLFMFTPFIAPIGFIYIYFANGYHKKNV